VWMPDEALYVIFTATDAYTTTDPTAGAAGITALGPSAPYTVTGAAAAGSLVMVVVDEASHNGNVTIAYWDRMTEARPIHRGIFTPTPHYVAVQSQGQFAQVGATHFRASLKLSGVSRN